MEPLTRLLAQARTFWAGLSAVRRVLVIGAVTAVVAGLGTYSYLSQPGEYVPLYTDRLTTEEVADLDKELRAANLPFKLRDPHTVTVPADRHAEITVAMAGAGIAARGGKGLELFDSPNPMETPFGQTVKYQRGLQGELSRHIGQIRGVASARVLVATPDPTPFARPQNAPTASVVVTPKPGAAVSAALAESIVGLVSRAVHGLKPENVTVIDAQSGRVVSNPNARDRETLPTGMLEYVRQLEGDLSKSAQDMLEKHLGPGRVVVQVRADVNTQKVKERQERYAPDEKVTIAERLINSSSTGGRAGGVTGAASNVRPAGGASGGGGGGSKEETVQTDYVVSKTVREMEDRMGAVTKLHVAAILDLTPPPAADGQQATALISVADAQKIIERAVGFQLARGDQISVTPARLIGPPLPSAEPDEVEAGIRRLTAYVSLAQKVSMALAVVMGLSVIPLLLLRRRAKPAAGAAGAAVSAASGATPSPTRQQLLDRYLEFARTNPDRTAAVFGLLAGQPAG